MIILTWEESNNHGQYYNEIWYIDSDDIEEINEILEVQENGAADHPKITIDDSKRPDNFYGTGGFASRLLSVVDENGKSQRSKVIEWYGK